MKNNIIKKVDKLIKHNWKANIDHCFNRMHIFADIIWPETIIISNKYPINDLKYFTIRIGGSIIWKIPIPIITKIFPPDLMDSMYHINIPKSFFINRFIKHDFGLNNYWSQNNYSFLSERMVNVFNDINLTGIPILSLFYHNVTFELSSVGQLEYDVRFELIDLEETTREHVKKYGLTFKVQTIHEFIIDSQMNTNLSCCKSMEQHFKSESSKYFNLIVKHIFSTLTCIPSKKNTYINLGKEKIQIMGQYIEQYTNLINPLGRIIADYMDDTYANTYGVISDNQTLKIFMNLDNILVVISGMGGLNIRTCDIDTKP